jgi:galactokinase
MERIAAAPGHWRNYIEGAWLRARHAAPESEMGGLRLVVDSNLPQGAALSSSAALCIALLHAWFGWNGIHLDNDALILAAQDAEWYTGSRCGTCDQAAIVLGRPGAVIHASLYPKDFSTAGARAIALPENLRVLVINSFTRRSISGAEKIAYTLNRFAYSMAMEIFQQALREAGYPDEIVVACGRLSNITPQALGGHAALYAVLRQIPERVPFAELRTRYDLPDLDCEYQRYFGDTPLAMQPQEIGLRGPLLFGIAESERARHFAAALESGDFSRAGQLMTIGHEGDRRVNRAGNAIHQRSDDAWLRECAGSGRPIEECPGVYGASSPALDRLVDVALDHGALGASLTGAGIAGTVLALCNASESAGIAGGVRTCMAGEAYRRIAGLHQPLDSHQIADATVSNLACMGAGEIGR